MDNSFSRPSPFLQKSEEHNYKNVFAADPEEIGQELTRSKAPRPIRDFSPLLHSRSIDTFALYQYDKKNGKISNSSSLLFLSSLANN